MQVPPTLREDVTSGSILRFFSSSKTDFGIRRQETAATEEQPAEEGHGLNSLRSIWVYGKQRLLGILRYNRAPRRVCGFLSLKRDGVILTSRILQVRFTLLWA